RRDELRQLVRERVGGDELAPPVEQRDLALTRGDERLASEVPHLIHVGILEPDRRREGTADGVLRARAKGRRQDEDGACDRARGVRNPSLQRDREAVSRGQRLPSK